jgi:CHRD domain-containing protein
MRRRAFSITAVALLGAVVVAIVGTYAMADEGTKNFRVDLQGYQEVPAISTAATGTFQARIDDGVINWTLSYAGLEGSAAPTQAHIHFGQTSVNGGIAVWLCSNLTVTPNPTPPGTQACPTSPATISGTATPANVVGPAGQGISAGEFDELVAAIRAGKAYANVHSTVFGGGEIRAQLGPGRRGDGDGD